MTLYEDDDKDDRRERFKRRRSRAQANLEDTPLRRRRTPYKREHADYDHWQEESEDEWFDYNS